MPRPTWSFPFPSGPARPGRRQLLTVAVVGLGVAVVGGTAALWWSQVSGGASPHPGASGPVVRTVAVARTDLASAIVVSGRLGYGTEREIKGLPGGRVTWLPASGATVARGQQLLRVDDRPVTLFVGDTPVFRALDTTNLVGRDVRVVADNLRALGYDIGQQPAVGATVHLGAPIAGGQAGTGSGKGPAAAGASAGATPTGGSGQGGSVKVREGDAVLTAAMVNAVKRWQAAVNLPQTGVVGPGDVLVLPGDVRVGLVDAQLGDEATGNLLTVTPTGKSVTAEANAYEVGSVRTGDRAALTLPNQRTTTGVVASISRSAGNTGGDGGAGNPAGATKVVLTITLNDPAAAADLDAGSVRAEFTTAVRSGVLAVPVGALLALHEGGYAVQVSGGPLLAVTTGLFAKGMVEISGEGIAEGTRVVTTS